VSRILLLILFTVLPVFAFAITADELRALAGQADKTQREKAGRFKHGDLRGLVRDRQIVLADQAKLVEQRSEKPISDNTGSMKINRKVEVDNPTNQTKKAVNKTKTPLSVAVIDEYIPPARKIIGRKITSDVVMLDTKQFGIKLGTWIDGQLSRKINNLERSDVVITTKQTLNGKRKILPSGTQLFAEKMYNPGTQRLEMRINKGVTPDGEEFSLLAKVYDLGKQAGLSGLIKEKKVAVPSFKKGLLAGGSRLVSDISPNNALGTVASITTDSVIGHETQNVSNALMSEYIIYVNQQSVLIRVDRSF